MKCIIQDKRNGPLYSFAITDEHKEIKVLEGHLFYNKIVEVEKYNDEFYKVKKLDYDEEAILEKYVDDEKLIFLDSLKEDMYVSNPYKRIYEIDGYWFFVPTTLTSIVEYLYENDLKKHSKIRVTKTHTTSKSRAPIINVNYDRLFQLVTDKKSPINAHFYCENKKDFLDSVYGDFYVLGSVANNEFQLELWEIIGNGEELFYSHFIQDLSSSSITHFDLAKHIKDPNAKVEDLLSSKMKLKLIEKIKWFRKDNGLTRKQVFEITKLFFPLESLVDEFTKKNYG